MLFGFSLSLFILSPRWEFTNPSFIRTSKT
ncbi:hypothetical protein NC652_022177 [Populus alba x Populus x berolinensis]|uniref:Uncharacterized protein n=1 Tax=Populus alba x Populus x berolinensis TaxID=444605 RepID=A0AAD6QFA7_9ROSI|nr:hypothetical protein NC652_022177 [Populus alba x Populus x berolinensis]KAJ6989299.1 hypothetical protein NC653_022009 [Populus alba x Populus x berolinensis]KAJ6989307.1 hypothetical protein NC653_022017 [Populus alba x Populus x berolinensis]